MLVTESGCKVNVKRGPDRLIFGLPGVNLESAPPSARTIWRLLEQSFVYRAIIDLSEVDYVDAYLADQLLKLEGLIDEKGGSLKVIGLSHQMVRSLRKYDYENNLILCHESEAVLPSFCSPRIPR